MAKISNNDIASALYATLKDAQDHELDALIERSVAFLAEQRVLSQSDHILAKVQALQDAENNITRARVFSAWELEPWSRDEIMAMLTRRYSAQEVILEEVKDPDLISGVKIEVGEDLIDVSLQNKVKQLHDYLIKN